ncbi:DinB family protein [Chitinophaga rhizophila]|uniref:DinB family protein n=1 Tax=Chitinophaga rhizophila TaxID=2866212 RepID=A0ABS7GDP3_9BACT|nr:DinB family protein [Chitinophaga rhizophila]MBW8685456.1 DinB family protein [Chitinophaga rhizophila]
MKDILLSYAAYNLWANNKIADVLQKLPDAQLDQETGSSFGTLRKTVYHMWDAESLWYQRLLLVEKTVKPAADFDGVFTDACSRWLEQSAKLSDWVKDVQPVRLNHVVAYYNTRKQYCKSTVIEILMQVFNHATYHRGQLVTLLRQAGITKIPVTDYSEFTRGRR